jgi:hypothetical protein
VAAKLVFITTMPPINTIPNNNQMNPIGKSSSLIGDEKYCPNDHPTRLKESLAESGRLPDPLNEFPAGAEDLPRRSLARKKLPLYLNY